MIRIASLFLAIAALAALSACGGGGSKATVNNIAVNPSTPAAGSLVQLTADITGNASGMKNWSVTAGSLSAEPPDFAIILRAAAKSSSALTLSTPAQTVYWLAPADGGAATITLSIEGSSKSVSVNLGSSPISLGVTDIDGGGKQVTVMASDVEDLYQAAFRVTYSDAWEPTGAAAGDFLGDSSETLFFGLTDQDGFVPVAITRLGDSAGVDGSGELAVLTFEPRGGASNARNTSMEQGFDIEMLVLRSSTDEPLL